MASEPTTLNPLLEVSDYENFVTRMVFDRLVTPDATGTKLLPRLAAVVPALENGGISRDGKTIVYHLRRDVRWQDGVPFTSADVTFSFAAVTDPRHNVVVRQGFDLIRSVSAPDRYTVVVKLRKPFAPAITWFSATETRTRSFRRTRFRAESISIALRSTPHRSERDRFA